MHRLPGSKSLLTNAKTSPGCTGRCICCARRGVRSCQESAVCTDVATCHGFTPRPPAVCLLNILRSIPKVPVAVAPGSMQLSTGQDDCIHLCHQTSSVAVMPYTAVCVPQQTHVPRAVLLLCLCVLQCGQECVGSAAMGVGDIRQTWASGGKAQLPVYCQHARR